MKKILMFIALLVIASTGYARAWYIEPQIGFISYPFITHDGIRDCAHYEYKYIFGIPKYLNCGFGVQLCKNISAHFRAGYKQYYNVSYPLANGEEKHPGDIEHVQGYGWQIDGGFSYMVVDKNLWKIELFFLIGVIIEDKYFVASDDYLWPFSGSGNGFSLALRFANRFPIAENCFFCIAPEGQLAYAFDKGNFMAISLDMGFQFVVSTPKAHEYE